MATTEDTRLNRPVTDTITDDDYFIIVNDPVDTAQTQYTSASTVGDYLSSYGEMHINGNSTATAVTLSDTFYQVVAGWTTGSVRDVTFTTDQLSADTAGVYMVSCAFSMTGFAADTFSFVIAKNDTPDASTLIERKTSSADVGALALTGLFSLAADDALTMWGKNQAGTNDFTITECDFVMVRVG